MRRLLRPVVASCRCPGVEARLAPDRLINHRLGNEPGLFLGVLPLYGAV